MEEKTKKKFNKTLMIPLFAVLAIGLVFAGGFVVNTFVIQSDVYEAFDGVEYAVLGDAGNYVAGDCSDEGLEWSALTGTIDMDGLFPGEARKVCVKFTNLGEADLSYTLANTIVQGNGNYEDCLYAFGENSISGVVSALETTTNGYAITVPQDAAVTNDCQIEVSLIRG